MHALLKLAAALYLIASLMAGSVAHAVETGSGGEMTSASAWLHAENDHDHVPADADRDYPHHHTVCHGHDLGAPLHDCAPPALTGRLPSPRPAPSAELAAGPPEHLLRPPIA